MFKYSNNIRLSKLPRIEYEYQYSEKNIRIYSNIRLNTDMKQFRKKSSNLMSLIAYPMWNKITAGEMDINPIIRVFYENMLTLMVH